MWGGFPDANMKKQATGHLNVSACRSVNQKNKECTGGFFSTTTRNQHNLGDRPSVELHFKGPFSSRVHYTPAVTSRLFTWRRSCIRTGSICLGWTLVCGHVAQPRPQSAPTAFSHNNICTLHIQTLTQSHCTGEVRGTNLGREEKIPSASKWDPAAAGVTFENALSVQYVSRDNHCVEALGEPRSAGGFEGLARPTPLRNETRRPVKSGQTDSQPGGVTSRSHMPFHTDTEPRSLCGCIEWLPSDRTACRGPGLKLLLSFTVVKHPTEQRVNTSS